MPRKKLKKSEVRDKPSFEDKVRAFRDPVYFCREWLKVIPTDYQEEILRDKSWRIAIIAGRRSGKTFVTALKVIHFAYTNPNTTTVVISSSMNQAGILYGHITEILKKSIPIVRNSIIKQTRTKLELSNGSKILILPCGQKGKTIRGHEAHLVVVDEAARVPDEVVDAFFPFLLTTEGTLIYLSSPPSVLSGFFYESVVPILYKPRWTSEQGFSVHWFPSDRSPYITEKILKDSLKVMGWTRYQREIMARFVSGESSFFDITDINKQTLSNDILLDESDVMTGNVEYGGTLSVGVDWGRTQADTAIVIVEQMPDGDVYVRFIKTFHGKKYTIVMNYLEKLVRQLNPKYLQVDIGHGQYQLDDLMDRGLNANGIDFTQFKEEMYIGVRRMLENGELWIPSHSQLKKELQEMVYEVTSSTRLKIYAHGHQRDDLVDALVMACYPFITRAKKPIYIGAVKKKEFYPPKASASGNRKLWVITRKRKKK